MTAHKEPNEAKDRQKQDCHVPDCSSSLAFKSTCYNSLQADGIVAKDRLTKEPFRAALERGREEQ
jgi:hypothetical protein